jgi:Predicted membrane protein (DUF2127)
MGKSHCWFAAFFAFGATMCAVSVAMLCFPGTAFDSLWRLNPAAHAAFASMGGAAPLLMVVVGTACGLAAIGLWRGSHWAVPLAIIILSVNIIGDLFNALVRHDYRALIGLPVGGAMIFYLAQSRRRTNGTNGAEQKDE